MLAIDYRFWYSHSSQTHRVSNLLNPAGGLWLNPKNTSRDTLSPHTHKCKDTFTRSQTPSCLRRGPIPHAASPTAWRSREINGIIWLHQQCFVTSVTYGCEFSWKLISKGTVPHICALFICTTPPPHSGERTYLFSYKWTCKQGGDELLSFPHAKYRL